MTSPRFQGNARFVATAAFALSALGLDQGTIGCLMPFMVPDLKITNTEIGLIASSYGVGFGIASFGIGTLPFVRGRERNCLIAVLGAFGIGSLLSSALVGGVASLVLARAVMGMLAGALMTLNQSVLGLYSPPEKLSTNMGIVNALGGGFAGIVLAPVLMVQVATAFGWRACFLALVVPAWLAAVFVFLNTPKHNLRSIDATASEIPAGSILSGVREVMRYRNIPLCALILCFGVGFMNLSFAFLPIYFVSTRGFSPTQMSLLIPVVGVSMILSSIVLPILSNRFGRKPVLMVSCITSVIAPLSACYFEGPVFVLGCLLFFGWTMSGTGVFTAGIVPAETVSREILSRTLGLVMAFGFLVGGLAFTAIGGWCADKWGPGAPLLVAAACALIAGLIASALKETAPGVADRRRRAVRDVAEVEPNVTGRQVQ